MVKIVKFYKPNCQPCAQLTLILDKHNVKYESIDVTTADVEKYNIRSVPVLMKTDDEGNEIFKLIGLNSEEVILNFCDIENE